MVTIFDAQAFREQIAQTDIEAVPAPAVGQGEALATWRLEPTISGTTYSWVLETPDGSQESEEWARYVASCILACQGTTEEERTAGALRRALDDSEAFAVYGASGLAYLAPLLVTHW